MNGTDGIDSSVFLYNIYRYICIDKETLLHFSIYIYTVRTNVLTVVVVVVDSLSRTGTTSGIGRQECTPVQTTRTRHTGTINVYIKSCHIGTQCGGNGTRQLWIIVQKQFIESRQTCQCGWNGTGQLIIRQNQVCEERQTGQCGWNGTGQLISM